MTFDLIHIINDSTVVIKLRLYVSTHIRRDLQVEQKPNQNYRQDSEFLFDLK